MPKTDGKKSRRVILIAVGLALAFSAIFGFFLYRYQLRGGVAEIVTKVLPFPAAIVEGRAIRYSDFQDDLKALERFYEEERGSGVSGSIFPDETELKRRVLDQLVTDKLAEESAARYGIIVTSEDVAQSYEKTILDQASLDDSTGKAKAESRAAETLMKTYGLRPSQFKNNILQPFLIRQKLEKALRDDEALNAENLKRAEEALAELNAGRSFREVAQAFSEDPNAKTNGGDRGEMGPGLLPPEVEAAAFSLKPGETSGVVKSVFGYHVLRVLDRQEQAGKITKVHLLEILIRPVQLDDYLEAQRKAASIITFVH